MEMEETALTYELCKDLGITLNPFVEPNIQILRALRNRVVDLENKFKADQFITDKAVEIINDRLNELDKLKHYHSNMNKSEG